MIPRPPWAVVPYVEGGTPDAGKGLARLGWRPTQGDLVWVAIARERAHVWHLGRVGRVFKRHSFGGRPGGHMDLDFGVEIPGLRTPQPGYVWPFCNPALTSKR